MLGHTHEDIDTLFGNFCKWLKRNNAMTVEGILDIRQLSHCFCCIELVICGKTAHQNVLNVLELKEMYDVKSWLLPNPHIFKFALHTCIRMVDTISFSHHRFISSVDGLKCEMHYKNWFHDAWLPKIVVWFY